MGSMAAGGNSMETIFVVKQYIENNLGGDLSVSRLAYLSHFSVAYFSKLFKKTEGIGCNYYVIARRMEKAQILLLNRELRLADIADQLGYQDVKYFSVSFKKYMGMTPSEYRERSVR